MFTDAGTVHLHYAVMVLEKAEIHKLEKRSLSCAV